MKTPVKINYLLIELLESFTENELGRFSHFVKSTYFNTDRYVADLFVILKTKVLGKRTMDAELQQLIFKMLFPAKMITGNSLTTAQKSLLNVKIGKLNSLARQFLCVEKIPQKPVLESELLFESLFEKEQYNMIRRKLKKDKKVLETTKAKGKAYYRFAHQLEESLLQYYHHKNLLLKKDNLEDLNKFLDLSYLTDKLELQLTMRSFSGVSSKKQYDLRPMEALSPLLALPQYSGHPLIQIYQTALMLMQTNETKNYEDLLRLLEEHVSRIPIESLKEFYVVATNFCGRQIRMGKLEYYQHLFELYKSLSEKKLLLENGVIPMTKLKNIIGLALKTGEISRANDFIEKYKKNIHKDYQKSVCHFNYGAIAFYQKDYKTAIHHFIRVDKVNLDYEVNCRMLLLKSYYEMDPDYDERTMQIFRSAEQFIQKHKEISVAVKRGFKNFVFILINLYRFRHKAGKKSLEAILNKLNGLSLISDKKWLLEKIKELES